MIAKGMSKNPAGFWITELMLERFHENDTV
jgi:hypothetical protein